MRKIKFALVAAAPLLCGSLGLAPVAAQTPNAPQAPAPAQPAMPAHHHPDMAAMHKDMCGNHYAEVAARMAFVETKLELTDAQKPLFAKWRQAALESAGKAKTACLAIQPPSGDKTPSIVERQAHEEAMLSAHLQYLQATKTPLAALYDSLTVSQKAVLDHAHGGGNMGMGAMRMVMRHHEMGRDGDAHDGQR